MCIYPVLYSIGITVCGLLLLTSTVLGGRIFGECAKQSSNPLLWVSGLSRGVPGGEPRAAQGAMPSLLLTLGGIQF